MKTRQGFVNNSSSSNFVIVNKTNKPKTMKDFAEETKYLVEQFNNEYSWNNFTEEEYLESASNYSYLWNKKETLPCCFGDEHGNTMGYVLDYMLRQDGETKSFMWFFVECRGGIKNKKLFKKYFPETYKYYKD
jgi:hypothetical protein